MVDEKVILQVLAEQQEYVQSYEPQKWVGRYEENLFELDSPLAQVVIGVRRSGKSTLCHKVLLEHHVKYGYANFDDDRLAKLKTEDLNTVLSCIYQVYGTDIKYIFLDEIQDVDGWHLFVNRLLRSNLHLVVTGSNAKLLSGELATHLTGRYNEIHLFPFSFMNIACFIMLTLLASPPRLTLKESEPFWTTSPMEDFLRCKICATSVAMYKV